MPREKDYQLNVRVPTSTRNAIASLGRMCGLNTSEMFRWLIDRAIEQDAEATIAAVAALSVAKFGPKAATALYDHEMLRLKYLKSGEAIETPDGRDIVFVTREEETTEEPDAAPRREAVRA